MSSFFRKRQPSTANQALPPNDLLNGPQQQQQQQQQQQSPSSQPQMNLRGDRESPDMNRPPNGQAQGQQPAPVSGPAQPNASQSQPQPNSTQPQRAAFPWSARRIALPPPLVIARPGVAPPTGPSPSPFPRYGHSLPLTASQTGELFLFGGLVRDVVKNDLYTFNSRDLSATLVQTSGEVPLPRVGHASALVSSVLIVWGGDTKTRDNDKQDEGLYLLNLGTREWTRVATRGTAPAGRYGHSVAMCGSRFYVFGGQVDGEFLNDLWCFDLNTLKTAPLWDLIKPVNEPPPRRTGHVMVTLNDTIYIFGGTDGSYHYNDTWSFDVNTRTWQELTCIGYIPSPREGHAAALVDDVIYIFGGRGVDGKDLNDLAAFKISNQRWFMFQNMGPGPSGRSGHAMATAGAKVFVLGGESFTAPKPDDPMLVHVLDTKNIRYPDANRPSGQQGQQGQQGRKPGLPNGVQQRAMSPTNVVPSDNEGESRRTMGGPAMRMQPFPTPNPTPTNSKIKAPPVRPPREDEVSNDGNPQDRERDRVMSPELSGRAKSPNGPPPNAMSPVPPTQQLPPTQQVQQPQQAVVVNAARTLPPQNTASAAARSASPVPPVDAFYYGGPQGAAARVSQSNGLPNGATGRASPAGMGHGVRGGSTENIAADLVRDLRAKDSELEALRRRETWMRAALAKASKAGFVWADNDLDSLREDGDLGGSSEEGNVEQLRKLSEIAFKLKQERATMQAIVAEQARAASERFADAERSRASALQEAAFCRAKLAAYESSKPAEVSRLDADKASELERQLQRSASERSALERKLTELTESLAGQIRLKEQVEERSLEAAKRAIQAEEALERVNLEHEQLLERHEEVNGVYRQTAEKLLTISSAQELKDAEERSNVGQFEDMRVSRDQHLKALEQAQVALSASSDRADELQEQWRRANDEIQRLKSDVAELNRELETRVAEADAARARLTDVENAWAKSREEADTHRALTTGSLGELLDFHRDIRADEERLGRAHAEKARVVELEAASLRDLLREANQRADEAQTHLTQQRAKTRTVESEQISLRHQLDSVRGQLANATTETSRLRKELTERENEARSNLKAASEKDIRLKTFRNYLADTGIVIDEEEVASSENGAPTRLYEVEARLAERDREHDALTRQLEDTRNQQEAAEERLRSLSSELGRAREQYSNTSKSADGARVAELEERLSEAEANHKERLQMLEQDYRTAIMCVKSTEKMLRKLKDELTKQKTLNETLQTEIDGLRGGSTDGIRRPNGKTTPSDDGNGPTSALRSQAVDAQRQVSRLTAENNDLHRRQELLQGDVERLRRDMDDVQRESERRLNRIHELEDTQEQLEASLSVARHGQDKSLAEKLQQENVSLKKENEQLSHKIELLLEVDNDPSSSYGGGLDRRNSGSSYNEDMDTEHMSSQITSQYDNWSRQQGNSSSNRYD